MVARQTDADKTTTRVYKYGLVPKGYLPEEGINELWRANDLWNKLVEIHRKSQADYKEARSSKHPEFAKAWQHFEKLEKQIKTAKEKKRDARMQAGSRDPSHPLIIKANNALNALISEKKIHYGDVVKPLRKEADKLIDTKTLNSEFNATINLATRVENSKLYNPTAEAVLVTNGTALTFLFEKVANY